MLSFVVDAAILRLLHGIHSQAGAGGGAWAAVCAAQERGWGRIAAPGAGGVSPQDPSARVLHAVECNAARSCTSFGYIIFFFTPAWLFIPRYL